MNEKNILEWASTQKKISPPCLMRKFKLTYKSALDMCLKIWLHQHIEARNISKELIYDFS